jgi:dihydroxyacetone kinase-like protein
MRCTRKEIVAILSNMVQVVEENEQYLNQLDSVIGDAEHGSNLKRALRKALDLVTDLPCENPADILENFGRTLATSGCGSGPLLYGLAIKAFGSCLGEKGSFEPQNVVEAMEAMLHTVKEKGGANIGDKTMVDALEPAVNAFKEAVLSGHTLVEAFDFAVQAAEKGMLETRNFVGKKGRSAYLGERGVGYQDPGATSTYLMLRSVYQTLLEKRCGNSES